MHEEDFWVQAWGKKKFQRHAIHPAHDIRSQASSWKESHRSSRVSLRQLLLNQKPAKGGCRLARVSRYRPSKPKRRALSSRHQRRLARRSRCVHPRQQELRCARELRRALAHHCSERERSRQHHGWYLAFVQNDHYLRETGVCYWLISWQFDSVTC